MLEEEGPCPVCQTMATTRNVNRTDAFGVICPRCGNFIFVMGISREISTRRDDSHIRKAISAWIQEQNSMRSVPEVDRATVDRAAATPAPGLIERSRRLLRAVARLTQWYGQGIGANLPSLVAVSWSTDDMDMRSLAKLLRDEGLLEQVPVDFTLTAKGVAEVEAERKRVVSDQAFVAMSFGAALKPIYDNGLYQGIKHAGYRPFRVDRHEHANRIDDEIMAQIRRSRFLVADFTGQKHGVYFEAGFALGLALPVIWSCWKDDIKGLHFDVRQYNCIVWTEPAELAARLQTRIEEILGAGPH